MCGVYREKKGRREKQVNGVQACALPISRTQTAFRFFFFFPYVYLKLETWKEGVQKQFLNPMVCFNQLTNLLPNPEIVINK